MIKDFVLKDGQDGYEIVADCVLKYWEENGYGTALVQIETSYDGKEYHEANHIVSPLWYGGEMEFDYDWWEGQKYLRIYGVKNIADIVIYPTYDPARELEEAKKLLDEEYERAKRLDYVRNPIAYALYQAWKKADKKKNKNDNT